MFADTDAIRALGSANSTHAADLASIAAGLSSLPAASAVSTLGPVGARFLSALAEAIADGSRAVAALSDRLAASNTTAYAAAAAYDDADLGSGTRIAGV
jgi:hypothetical protein